MKNKIYVMSNSDLLNISIILISMLNIGSVFLDIPKKYFVFINSLIIFIVALLKLWLLCQERKKNME